jgi:enoyl-CoA hydratase/carnithine racemase
MSTYTTLKYIEKDQIATIYFARPEVHNALNNIMIEEIISIFKEI